MFCFACELMRGSGNCKKAVLLETCQIVQLDNRLMQQNEDFLEDAHAVMNMWDRAEHYDLRQEGAH